MYDFEKFPPLMERLLETYQLTKRLGGRVVVDCLNLYVNRGEIVGLLGPNGAGKTTIYHLLLGMYGADQGQVIFKGSPIDDLPTYRRARLGMGYLMQEPSVFGGLTVEQNLRAVLELKQMPFARAFKSADQYLHRFGLWSLKKQRASTLSGGERRKLELARLLITEPLILLLDEPFKGLDCQSVDDLLGMIQIAKREKIGILLTDHAVPKVLSVCDRAYMLDDGRVFEYDFPSTLVRKKELCFDYKFRSRSETETGNAENSF